MPMMVVIYIDFFRLIAVLFYIIILIKLVSKEHVRSFLLSYDDLIYLCSFGENTYCLLVLLWSVNMVIKEDAYHFIYEY